MPELETRALLQAGRRLADSPQVCAAVQCCAATGHLLQRAASCLYTLCFQDMSAHSSGCAGSLVSMLVTTSSLYLP